MEGSICSFRCCLWPSNTMNELYIQSGSSHLSTWSCADRVNAVSARPLICKSRYSYEASQDSVASGGSP